MHRILYLEGIPDGKVFKNVRLLNSKESVFSLYETEFNKIAPPEITLDCRELKRSQYSTLLKFIEEYKGSINLIAKEPIPVPILSRFSDYRKYFVPKQGYLIESKIKRVPQSIKQKVMQILQG